MLTQVNTTTNTVTLQNLNQIITVVDNNNGNNVEVTQPLVNVIEVATPGTIGPIGPQGPSGSFPSTGSFATTGSNNFVGSQTITGSVLGNVVALSVSSNTASLNLSLGSFYTLQLTQSTNTYINPTNIRAGETVSLLVSTTGSATVSFPSIILQPSGSPYVPTTTTGKDVLTFISFDNTNLYLASVKNLI
jgi:hypothetical protein